MVFSPSDDAFGVYVGESGFPLLVCECLSVFDAEAGVFSAGDVFVFEDGYELFSGEFVLFAAETFAAILVVGGVV